MLMKGALQQRANLEELARILSGLETDWKKREDTLLYFKTGLGDLDIQKAVFDKICSIGHELAVQHSDLRSAIVKQASEVIAESSELSTRYKNLNMYFFSEVFILDPLFIKALGSGNKVIAKYAQNSLVALFSKDCVSIKTLKKIYQVMKTNKIPAIRERAIQAIYTYMQNVLSPIKKSSLVLFNNALSANVAQMTSLPSIETIAKIDMFKKNTPNSNTKTSVKKISTVAHFNSNSKFENIIYSDLPLYHSIAFTDLDFFKDAISVFMQDSNQGVRDYAKKANTLMPGFENSLRCLPSHDTQSLHSIETTEDQSSMLDFQMNSKLECIPDCSTEEKYFEEEFENINTNGFFSKIKVHDPANSGMEIEE